MVLDSDRAKEKQQKSAISNLFPSYVPAADTDQNTVKALESTSSSFQFTSQIASKVTNDMPKSTVEGQEQGLRLQRNVESAAGFPQDPKDKPFTLATSAPESDNSIQAQSTDNAIFNFSLPPNQLSGTSKKSVESLSPKTSRTSSPSPTQGTTSSGVSDPLKQNPAIIGKPPPSPTTMQKKATKDIPFGIAFSPKGIFSHDDPNERASLASPPATATGSDGRGILYDSAAISNQESKSANFAAFTSFQNPPKEADTTTTSISAPANIPTASVPSFSFGTPASNPNPTAGNIFGISQTKNEKDDKSNVDDQTKSFNTPFNSNFNNLNPTTKSDSMPFSFGSTPAPQLNVGGIADVKPALGLSFQSPPTNSTLSSPPPLMSSSAASFGVPKISIPDSSNALFGQSNLSNTSQFPSQLGMNSSTTSQTNQIPGASNPFSFPNPSSAPTAPIKTESSSGVSFGQTSGSFGGVGNTGFPFGSSTSAAVGMKSSSALPFSSSVSLGQQTLPPAPALSTPLTGTTSIAFGGSFDPKNPFSQSISSFSDPKSSGSGTLAPTVTFGQTTSQASSLGSSISFGQSNPSSLNAPTPFGSISTPFSNPPMGGSGFSNASIGSNVGFGQTATNMFQPTIGGNSNGAMTFGASQPSAAPVSFGGNVAFPSIPSGLGSTAAFGMGSTSTKSKKGKKK